MNRPAEATIQARRVLLDALDALADHRRNLVLVGAQAVYLRTSGVDLSFSSSFTTDADLVVDPTDLADEPDLARAMVAAGFERAQADRPGIWGMTVTLHDRQELVPVDLIVPDALAGPGTRGARLGRHGNDVAGRAVGLEAAVVDRSPMLIAAHDPADERSIEVNVAGPMALLIAKLHKITDRAGEAGRRPDRLIAKDAADAYRIMLTVDVSAAAASLRALLRSEVAASSTDAALCYLREPATPHPG